MSARLLAGTTRRILRQLQHDHRSAALVLIMPVVLLTLVYFMWEDQPQFDRIALVLLGVFPLTIMFLILLGYIILGFFMDQIAILILTVPVVLPTVIALGFDPIWFGVIVVVTAEVGMVTPPLGMNVFVVARYTRRPIGELFRGVMPHVWAHLIVIALLTLFPGLVLWLPSTMN